MSRVAEAGGDGGRRPRARLASACGIRAPTRAASCRIRSRSLATRSRLNATGVSSGMLERRPLVLHERRGRPRWPRTPRRRSRAVDAGPLGQHQRLGERLVERVHDRVHGELHRRAGAERADVEDPRGRAGRAPAGPGRGRPPSPPTMTVSSPRSTSGDAAGHRRVEQRGAALARPAAASAADRLRVDRAGLQHDACPRAGRRRCPSGPRVRRVARRRRRRARPGRRRPPAAASRAVVRDRGAGPAATAAALVAGPVVDDDVDARPRAAGPAIAAPIRPVPIDGDRRTSSREQPPAVDGEVDPVHRRFLSRKLDRVDDVGHGRQPAGRRARRPTRVRAACPPRTGCRRRCPGACALTRIGASSTASVWTMPDDAAVDGGHRRRARVRPVLAPARRRARSSASGVHPGQQRVDDLGVADQLERDQPQRPRRRRSRRRVFWSRSIAASTRWSTRPTSGQRGGDLVRLGRGRARARGVAADLLGDAARPGRRRGR